MADEPGDRSGVRMCPKFASGAFLNVLNGRLAYFSGGSADGGYSDRQLSGDGGCSATVVAADESFGDQPSIAVKFTRAPGGIIPSPVAHDAI